MSTDYVQDGRKGRFWMDDEVVDRYAAELGVHGLAVYTILCRRANKNGSSYPSIRRISEDLGISERQAKRELKKLRDLRLIAISARRDEKGRQQSSVYKVLEVPEPGDSESPCTEPGDSETPGGEGSVSHPKEDTESKEVTTKSVTNVPDLVGEAQATPPPSPPISEKEPTKEKVKPEAPGAYANRRTAELIEQYEREGRSFFRQTGDEKTKLGSQFDAEFKHREVQELDQALLFRVQKAAGLIDGEYPSWSSFRYCLQQVDAGWQPKGTLSRASLSEEQLAQIAENERLTAELLREMAYG